MYTMARFDAATLAALRGEPPPLRQQDRGYVAVLKYQDRISGNYPLLYGKDCRVGKIQ
jgi:hypothetical protein